MFFIVLSIIIILFLLSSHAVFTAHFQSIHTVIQKVILELYKIQQCLEVQYSWALLHMISL